jgi:hypothetical protein
MTRPFILATAAALTLSVSACDGLKEAFTAHVDVVARAGSQELSTERLGAMVGNSTIPVQPEVIKAVAELWVSYQLVALSAARGDSLSDDRLIDEAMWAQIAQAQARKFFLKVAEDFEKADTTDLAQRYAQGELFAAQHILIGAPREGLSPQRRDSLRRVAESLRQRVTAGNFEQLAREQSQDPGSAERGGSLGVFGPGMMVPEFEAGVKALAPGQISPAVVDSDFGFHIIRRHTLDEVREDFKQALKGSSDQKAETAFYEKLESEAKLTLKPGMIDKIRAVGKEPEAMLGDKAVLATSRSGDFTAGKLAKWVLAFPPQAGIREQLQQGPDETVESFVKAMVRNELLIAKADEAKVTADSADLADIRATFRVMLSQAWQGLGVDPAAPGEAGMDKAERERIFAGRADDYLDRLLKTNGQGYIDIPQPLHDALRAKFSSRVITAGLDRAAERATIVRAALDSTRGRGAGGGMGGGAGMGAPVAVPPGTPTQPLPEVPRDGRQ